MTVCRPWEISALSVPLEPSGNATPTPGASSTTPPATVGTDTVYNRAVSIYRLQSIETQPGQDPYSGDIPDLETPLFSNLPASIQVRSAGRAGRTVLPTDISVRPAWVIYVPGLPLYSIRDRDIVVDDEFYRYGVGAAAWTIFGYTLECVRLEVY